MTGYTGQTASQKRQARGLRRVGRLRRLLRQLPDDVVAEVRAVVEEGANRILADMQSFVPVDEGDLLRALELQLSGDGLRAYIGPGAKALRQARQIRNANRRAVERFGEDVIRRDLPEATQELLFEAFKAVWVERGTKGNPQKRIPAQPARPFIAPAYDVNADKVAADMDAAVTRALKNALARAEQDKSDD